MTLHNPTTHHLRLLLPILLAALVAAPAAAQGAGAGQARFVSMVAGSYRTCGIDAAGGVACWGQDSDGYSRVSLLGVGEREMERCTAYDQTRPCSRVPLRVAVPAPVKGLAVGNAHTCALATDGRVFCWGENRLGSLGTAVGRGSGTPQLMQTPLRFTALSGWSGTTCGVATDGSAYCWGVNDHGQGGTGARPCGMYPCNRTPTAVGGPVRFTRVSAGEYLTCGVARDGAVYCWGIQAGDTTEAREAGRGRPLRIELPEPVAGVSVGSMHACALGRSGQAYCWGTGSYGDLGDGTTGSTTTPVAVEGGHRFTAVSAGARVSCGLTAEGALWCWGRNNWGQLGTGRTDMQPHPTPVRVPAETRFRTVAVHEAVCATDAEGRAWCWGANGWGQGGTGPVDGETPCLSLVARGHCSPTPRPVREPR